MFVAAGGTLVVSPDPGTGIVLASSARASLLYTIGAGRLDLSAVSGAEPNILTGQILRLDQVGLRGTMPLSERRRIFGSVSVGYLRGSPLRVRRQNLESSFQGVLADAEITWTAADRVQLFARYQFLDQIAEPNPPRADASVLRSAAIVGIQLFSRPPIVTSPTFRESQRVDRSDGAAPAP